MKIQNSIYIALVILLLASLACNIGGTAPATESRQEPATAAPVIVSTPTEPPTVGVFDIGSTITGDDGMILLYMPAGEFTMGSDDGGNEEKPVHTVSLDAFWIDQTEVTNNMFASFIGATGYQTDAEKLGLSYVYDGSKKWVSTNGADWQHPTGPSSDVSGKEDHPVIHVSWNDAVAYCEWAGRRLPTEAEWEKAARGTDQSIYPWGNDAPNINLLNYARTVGYTTIVGNYPDGVSPYGALDMAGNVSEWTADWYDVYPGGDPSISSDFGQIRRVVRGGAWSSLFESFVRSAIRSRADPTNTIDDIGFRCAASLP